MGSEWRIITLRNICSKIGSGATPRGGREVYLPMGEISLIRSQNIRNTGFTREGLVYINSEQAEQLQNVEVMNNDVLLNITGDSVARCCQVVDDVLPARVNQHVAIIRPDSEKLDPQFLRYCLVSPNMQSMMLSWAGSGGTRNALTKGMIESFKIIAPENVKEQRAIAHILGSLDDKIELNRRMNETLEAMARAIFKSWFVDFDPVRAKAEGRDTGLPAEIADLFPDSFDDSELGPIPKGWRVGEIKECCRQIQNGGTPKRSESEYWNLGTIPWLTSGEVRQTLIIETENMISKLGLENSSAKWLAKDSTLVALYGATAGQVAFISSKMTTNQAVCGLIPKGNFRYFNYLSLDRSVCILANLARGSAQQNISKGIVERTKVVIPSANILESFDQLLSPLFDKWVANLKESKTLASLCDTLLPKLISGELRLPAAALELATQAGVPEAEKLVEKAGV